MDIDVLIVGEGLSGLHTAYELEKAGYNYKIIEARNRIGGRVLSQSYESAYDSDKYISNKPSHEITPSAFDLGPSWFWPGQTRLETLAKELNLTTEVFDQFSDGASIYGDAQGNLQKDAFGISMQGSYRLEGGISQFTHGLAQEIPVDNLLTNTALMKLEYEENHDENRVVATVSNNNNQQTINAKQVVIALPPRNAMTNIHFKPSLQSSRVSELKSFPTWMANQAKFVAVYETPFWQELGFSGDAISQLGPLREIHDASSSNRGSDETAGYAIFGFVGIPASYRIGNEQQVIDACVQQLERLFGEQAAKPLHVSWKDWSTEKYTSTQDDMNNNSHAESSLQSFTDWNGQLIWSGTETAGADFERNNGYLEGALESSMRTIELIRAQI